MPTPIKKPIRYVPTLKVRFAALHAVVCLAFLVTTVVDTVRIASADHQVRSDTAVSRQVKYSGRLQRQLRAYSDVLVSTDLRRSTARQLGRHRIPRGSRVYVGRIEVGELNVRLALIESSSRPTRLLVDRDLDGVFAVNEEVRLQRAAADDESVLQGEVLVKSSCAYFDGFPLLLLYETGSESRSPSGKRTVLHQRTAFAVGTVDILGSAVEVQYSVGIDGCEIDATVGEVRMDSNRDGRVETVSGSPEAAHAMGAPVVFRVGDTYLVTREVNTATGSIQLESVDASEYVRIEVVPGLTLPEIDFTDLQGVSRSLSEFRGKYVLIVFWTSWCGPCIAEIPALKEARRELAAKGLEIVGMSGDDNTEMVEAVVKRHGVPWVEARPESTKFLLTRRLGIRLWPAKILINPDGVIVSTDRGPLRLGQEDLVKTLENIFSPGTK